MWITEKLRCKTGLAAFVLTGLFCTSVLLNGQEKKTTTVQFVPLAFQNAEHSDQFRSGRLAERFRQIATGAVPRRKNSWSVRVDLCGIREVQHFEVKPDPAGKRELLVKVPLAFESWREDVLAHNWLMSVFLLAQLGEEFDKEGRCKSHLIQGHWLVRGLARKAAGDTLFALRPFARSNAGAYVFCANGITMPLKSVVTGMRDYGRDLAAVAELESGFAGLLVEACEDAGYFRNGLAEPALRAALRSTDTDLWQDFLKTGTTANLFSGRDPEDWFQRYLDRRMISVLSPLSVEYFETCYREQTTLFFKESDGTEGSCGLSGLVENWAKFPAQNSLIDDLQLRLNVLSYRAPAGFQQPLSDIRRELTALRMEQTEVQACRLQAAEDRLFEAIRQRIELEYALGEMEKKHIAPADRFQRTLRAAGTAQQERNLILPAVQKKLDEWDDYR